MPKLIHDVVAIDSKRGISVPTIKQEISILTPCDIIIRNYDFTIKIFIFNFVRLCINVRKYSFSSIKVRNNQQIKWSRQR